MTIPLDRGSFEAMCRQGAIKQAMMVDDRWGWCRILGDQWILVDTRDKDIAPWLLSDGFWESWVSVLVARVVKPGDFCLDIGANYGYYSLLLHKLGAKVYAVEANSFIFERLAQTLSRVNHHAKNGAIYSVEGETLTLSGIDTRDGSSSVMGQINANGESYELPVRSFTLDRWLEAHRPVDFIKIDIEGAEYEFWKGAQNVISDSPNLKMVMEFSTKRYGDQAGEFIDSILEAGFKLYVVNTEGKPDPTNKKFLLDASNFVDLYLQRN